MNKSILKKILAFIMASSSVIMTLNNQVCLSSYNSSINQKKLKFDFPQDKGIFVETFNNMLECTESCPLTKDASCEFTISDYNTLKNYILNSDGLEPNKKEIAILSCVRSMKKRYRDLLGESCF